MYQLTSKNINDYHDDGLLIIRDIFSKETIRDILNDSKEIFIHQIKANNISNGVYNNDNQFKEDLFELFKKNYDAFLGAAKLCQHSISLFKASTDATLLNLLNQLGIRKPSICVKPIIYFNSKHLAKMESHYRMPIHQDYRSMLGSSNSIVIWLPLVDLNYDLGPVEFVPGSHKNGIYETETHEWGRCINHKFFHDDSFISYEMKPGDLVLFSAFTVHRSGNNISNDVRWSMHFRYNDIEENNFIDRNYPHPYQVYTPTFKSNDNLEKLKFSKSKLFSINHE
ncbi:phytanoyl-CoA dioxygenase [Candidatus Marinamargulisbacteria bacterium SCGC AG-333-B06]|nr:phytanoyl-CoA dioxygenase [Candidatus Marinamargulisbacteria bacterium SCGC AG-333-B06]